ncbi:MAG: hypothetical protein RIQ93_1739 [Verrucomicrobiota bacterium]|jgi:hypothetical protein
MNASPTDPFRSTLAWLAVHTRFPLSRLQPRAELGLFVAALASAEEAEEQRRFLIQRRDPAQTSALRAHGLRRSQVHFKCDNSAKV